MGKYIIKTKPYEEEIEANSDEDAMDRFVIAMNLDMHTYFEIIPVDNSKSC